MACYKILFTEHAKYNKLNNERLTRLGFEFEMKSEKCFFYIREFIIKIFLELLIIIGPQDFSIIFVNK